MCSDKNNIPLVSVVVLNYNGKKFLQGCFLSLKNQSYNNLEIIMVDNDSSDESVDFVQSNFPDIIIVKNNENFGFAEGNNIGIKNAKGDYIFILNNDTQIDDKCIEELVASAQKNENIGMCAPKILSTHNHTIIDSIGLNIYFDGLARGRGRGETDNGQYDNMNEALLPSACAALYRRKTLEEIGLFDELFFIYCEDTDLGIRARLAGWQCSSVPKSIVYHYYSGTIGKYSETKAFLAERNHFFVAIKNFPVYLILLLPAYTLSRYVLIIYGIITKKGPAARFQSSKTELAVVLFKAFLSFLRYLPYAIRERKKIQRNKKISNKELLRLLKRYRLKISQITLLE